MVVSDLEGTAVPPFMLRLSDRAAVVLQLPHKHGMPGMHSMQHAAGPTPTPARPDRTPPTHPPWQAKNKAKQKALLAGVSASAAQMKGSLAPGGAAAAPGMAPPGSPARLGQSASAPAGMFPPIK